MNVSNKLFPSMMIIATMMITACSSSKPPVSDSGVDGETDSATSLSMFDAWERMRSALRKSSDHLPAVAEALVATKDAAKLFEFVRDRIATYPPATDGFSNALYEQRWGARGTLRGGAGTPREKAELLVELYTKAGFEADVVKGKLDAARFDGKKILLRAIARTYNPPISSTEAAEWKTALGHTTLTPRKTIDVDGKRHAALVTSLKTQLPEEAEAPFDFTVDEIPLVRVKVDGVDTYANPLISGLAFGDAGTSDDPTPLGTKGPTQKIHVKLEAARADAPYERFTLVENQFDTEDVVGRRIQVAFAPPVKIDTLVGMRLQDVETVVPMLSVVGPDLKKEEVDRLSTVGNMISLGGNVYERGTEGGLIVNGDPIAAPESDPTAIGNVDKLEAIAQGAAFSRIGVTVSAFDKDGKNVSRLGANAFTVLEDDKPVSFSLTRNEAPPPRVVLLFDVSTSVPAEFVGSGAVALGNSIVTQLYAAYPEAKVRVATINFGANFLSTVWATSLTEAKDQVQGLATAPGSSEIWQALYEAEREKPTVIVMITDAGATDDIEPKFQSALATGAPVLSIAVGTIEAEGQAVLDRISTLSGGKSLPVTKRTEAVAAAIDEIKARAAQDYLLSYQAPKTGPTTRTVKVTCNGKTSTTQYDVPTVPAIPFALSGLYLTVTLDGRDHTVTLAGFSLGYSTAFPEITTAMLDDVRAMLLGRASISVEGAAPSPSIVLEDWISAKIGLQPLWDAVSANDNAKIKAALTQGVTVPPTNLSIAQSPLPDAQSSSSLTFETGPRIVAMIQKIGAGGPVTRHLDLFALSRWATAAEDPRVAWERTLEATSALAVVEAELLSGTSTLEGLNDISLSLVEPGQADTQEGLSDVERLAWSGVTNQFNNEYRLLVPLKPGPFWAIHLRTGTVIGMLANGTGGGDEGVCDTYHAANSYIQALSLAGGLAGVSLGGWAALAQWEVENVTMATIVIGSGGDVGDLSNPAGGMACGMINDAIGNAFPPYGGYDAIVSTLDTIGADTGAPQLCGGGGGVCQ